MHLIIFFINISGSVDSMSNKLQHLTTHTSTISARQTSTPVTRTYYNRLTTTVTTPKPHMFHQCQISGSQKSVYTIRYSIIN